MKFYLCSIFAVFLLFVTFSAGSDVLDLTTATFDDTISENALLLVEFYAPWCGHCKKLTPEYEIAATELKDEGIVLARVDGTQEPDLMTRFAVKGFPTIFFFKNGEQITYTGPRVSAGIVEWLRKKSGPAAVEITTAEDLTEFANLAVSVIGHFAKDSEGYAAFLAAADASAVESFQFGVVTDAAVTKSAGAEENSVLLNRDFDEDVTYDGELDSKSIIKFVTSNGFPYLEHAQTSWMRLREKGTPIGLLIFDEAADDAEETRTLITDLAKEYSSKFGFAYIGKEYAANAKEMGVSGERLPTIVILTSLGKSYPYADASDFDKAGLSAWLDGIADGSIKPNYKSEPIPESNDGPVTVVVGNNFQELVLDSEKDVLVEFYAPWCGHCQSLVPIWDSLGEHFADNENVVIAKIDATANDNPVVQLQGFPTIYFFSATDKTPKEYDGPRDLQAFIDFIDNKGSVPKDEHHGHSHDHEL